MLACDLVQRAVWRLRISHSWHCPTTFAHSRGLPNRTHVIGDDLRQGDGDQIRRVNIDVGTRRGTENLAGYRRTTFSPVRTESAI
jgi:hypothetical protein